MPFQEATMRADDSWYTPYPHKHSVIRNGHEFILVCEEIIGDLYRAKIQKAESSFE
jgi:hypothetical protein